MVEPRYTIVIPTRNRPQWLPRALASAFAQTVPPLEVIVVDDGSTPPVPPPQDARVRLIRHDESRGTAAARNAGIAAARGRFLTFLDDDDELLPRLAELSLAALAEASAPPPVAVLTAVEVVDEHGTVVERRMPPTLPRGRHFALEEPPRGTSFLCKQSLFVEVEVLRALGGFDESFASRVPTELFLRLNPVCSLVGVPEVGYRHHRHPGPRLSRDRTLRGPSFEQLVEKHADAFRAHPRGYARLLVGHARKLLRDGDPRGALRALVRAATLSPELVSRAAVSSLIHRVKAARRR